ncbi:MAG: cytochrome P460 family protein [Candidatus Kapabacteria bacterium]|jgi:hypothetical protein|nr:cytochrome P460 family protein [Candidatus Kapabacteria bacterium]
MKTLFYRICVVFAMVVLVYACTQPTPAPQVPADFIAGDSNLVGVTAQWSRIAGPYVGTAGPDGSFLGTAHSSRDTSVTRTVYARNNFVTIAKDANGRYPVGTILVKYFRRRSDSVIVSGAMMVKRGGAFAATNPTGWEWITLNAAGNIANRFVSDSAAALCVGCHRTRMSNDYSWSLK